LADFLIFVVEIMSITITKYLIKKKNIRANKMTAYMVVLRIYIL
jgi:hypothetical protein